MKQKAKFIKHIKCPQCGSSDGNSLYDDGHTHCFVCGHNTQPKRGKLNEPQEVPPGPELDTGIRPLPKDYRPLSDRRISAETARKYGVTVVADEESEIKHVYPYYDKDGNHVANKLRRRFEKAFKWEGMAARTTLFGQQLFPPGAGGKRRAITIVEGECDAMAAFEMLGSKYPVVSVKGASSAAKDCTNSFEYLNQFDEIVICFDKDEGKIDPATNRIRYPGQEAALAVANLFEIGKVRILTLADHKDANDYLMAGSGKKFIDEWFNAPKYTPTGIKLGKDMWAEISTPKNYETVSYPWDGLNEMTYGMRLSELVVVTADTGVGKTSFLKEIEYHVLKNTERGVGFLHLEEPNADTALGLMSIAANKPLHLPDVRETVSADELRAYYDEAVNSERVVIWDHFGSNDIHEVLAKIRHMTNLGCKYIVLDHLSIVVSDQEGDERKQLDEISTKLKMLCMELNIAVLAVIHQNRAGQIRGTAGVEQIANMVIKLFRDKEDANPWRRNVTKAVIQKNRFCGKTGPACYLYYHPDTGRLTELDEAESRTYEAGGAIEEQWGNEV